MIFKSHQCVFANGKLLLSPYLEWGDPSFYEIAKVVTLFYTPRERNSGRYMGIITLTIRLFVQIRPWSVTSFCFDIGITYLAQGCFTMRQCVVYILDSSMTFIFD